jgi:gamma-glutamylcyclotransferase (GGCT)/AIG2-like uncharacterized protein YtfP
MSAGPGSMLFVYGTLRRAVEAPAFRLFAEHATYFDDGRVQAKMYDFESYPGVVLSDHADDQVAGEVYTLRTPTPTLALLDRYEGVAGARAGGPALYERVRLQVATRRHGSLDAWIYVFIGAVDQRSRIESGDYLDHLRRHPGIRPPAIE